MPSSASDTDSHDLFPVMRRHRRERAAQVFVDNVSLGLVLRSSHITPAMRAHAITIKELEPVLAGKIRVRTFRCNGQVRIVAVEGIPQLSRILAA